MTFEEVLPKIPRTGATDDGILFVFQTLDYAFRQKTGPTKNITATEFVEGFAKMAKEQFGGLAKDVLAHMGIRSTLDVGKVVFALIEAGIFVKTSGDNLSDFDGIYDFESKFDMATIVRELSPCPLF